MYKSIPTNQLLRQFEIEVRNETISAMRENGSLENKKELQSRIEEIKKEIAKRIDE